jgi:hypothetical protein
MHPTSAQKVAALTAGTGDASICFADVKSAYRGRGSAADDCAGAAAALRRAGPDRDHRPAPSRWGSVEAVRLCDLQPVRL